LRYVGIDSPGLCSKNEKQIFWPAAPGPPVESTMRMKTVCVTSPVFTILDPRQYLHGGADGGESVATTLIMNLAEEPGDSSANSLPVCFLLFRALISIDRFWGQTVEWYRYFVRLKIRETMTDARVLSNLGCQRVLRNRLLEVLMGSYRVLGRHEVAASRMSNSEYTVEQD